MLFRLKEPSASRSEASGHTLLPHTTQQLPCHLKPGLQLTILEQMSSSTKEAEVSYLALDRGQSFGRVKDGRSYRQNEARE